jgi:hypothetical protein
MSDLNQIHAALQRPSLNDGQYRDCYGSAFGHRLSPGRQSKEFWTWGLLHKKTGDAAQNLASTSTPTTDSSTLEFSCTALSPESQPHSKNEIIPNPYETRMDQKKAAPSPWELYQHPDAAAPDLEPADSGSNECVVSCLSNVVVIRLEMTNAA